MTVRQAAKKAIGVFDSGVGGLTVFKALRKKMPHENLIYFGDTARLPYGSKSKDVVTRFSLEIARFLVKKDIKLFVVACNSASALALAELKDSLRIPVLGVVEPAVRAAVAASRTGTVGVIGTEATVSSGVYQRSLRDMLPGLRVVSAACPLLVPLVEEGWWDHPVSARVAAEYLRPLRRTKMDTLILGCTHYPLIKPLLSRTVGGGVRLIDSGEEVAREVDALLEAEGLKRAALGGPKGSSNIAPRTARRGNVRAAPGGPKGSSNIAPRTARRGNARAALGGPKGSSNVAPKTARTGRARAGGRGEATFYVTDAAKRFRMLLARILGGKAPQVRLVRFPF